MNTPEGWKSPADHYTGVRCMCVLTGCRAGPGCPHYCDHCKRHIAAHAAAPTPPGQPAAQGELTDRGPWKVTEVGNLQSDDFEHDVTLQISGDFEFEDQRLAYADGLCNLLNSSIAADRAARKRPEAEVAEIMEAVKLALSNKLSIHEVERLVRGEKS